MVIPLHNFSQIIFFFLKFSTNFIWAAPSKNVFKHAQNVDSDSSQVWAKSHLGPVVQSIVSLTSSLRVISLTVLVDSIYNILIFFAEKCE